MDWSAANAGLVDDECAAMTALGWPGALTSPTSGAPLSRRRTVVPCPIFRLGSALCSDPGDPVWLLKSVSSTSLMSEVPVGR
jgi:hypothetical protein